MLFLMNLRWRAHQSARDDAACELEDTPADAGDVDAALRHAFADCIVTEEGYMVSSYICHKELQGAYISLLPNHFCGGDPEPTLSYLLDQGTGPTCVQNLAWSAIALPASGWCTDLPGPGKKRQPSFRWIFQPLDQAMSFIP